MSRSLIPWLFLLVSPSSICISGFSPSSSTITSTRKHTRRFSPIRQSGVMMVQPPPSVEYFEIQETSTQVISPSSLSMTSRPGFELPDLRNLFTIASSSTEQRVGTNKQMFLQSLDTLNTLNQASKKRTELLDKMISEKVTTKDLNNALTTSEADGILPTASLENPGLESIFSSVAPGTWKVIYAPHMTTIAGIAGGKFDVQYTLFNDGTMTSHARYNFPVIGEGYLSVSGTYGSVDNRVSRVDFDKAWIKPFDGKNSEEIDGPYESLEDVPASPVKDIINSIGKAMFVDGVAIFPVSFLDDDTIVFDFELLGTKICAKKLLENNDTALKGRGGTLSGCVISMPSHLRRDVILLRRLLKAGINVDAVDYDKRAAVHIAAAEGNVAALKVLVEDGANLDARDLWGNTASEEEKSAKATLAREFLTTLKL